MGGAEERAALVEEHREGAGGEARAPLAHRCSITTTARARAPCTASLLAGRDLLSIVLKSGPRPARLHAPKSVAPL